MKIFVPENFIPERKYIVDVIFKDFLGLSFELLIHTKNYYLVELPNKNQIIIKDYFWSNIDEKEGYLHAKNIPQRISFFSDSSLNIDSLPVIYGEPIINIDKNTIICHIDILASSFFMLTRWEEYFATKKDKFTLVADKENLSYKNKFTHRPIVNEYIELLKILLLNSGINQNFKTHNFEIIPTHDVDFLLKFTNFFSLIKCLGGDIFKLKSFRRALNTLKDFSKIRKKIKIDPYDTFDILMDFSEHFNLKSIFYFIASSKNEKYSNYDIITPKAKDTILKILKRGHKIGIHSSRNTFKNFEQQKKEYLKLSNIAGKIIHNRQDYLIYDIQTTWHNLEQLGIKFDSSIGFQNISGFKAGVCYQYPLFDIIKRTKLNLIEQPLIFMEQTSKLAFDNTEDFQKHLSQLKNTVKKFNGIFTILWHNNNIINPYFEDYFCFYQNLLE